MEVIHVGYQRLYCDHNLYFRFYFPSQMIRAIRENDTDKSNTHCIIAAFVFGCMMLLIGMMLNR